MVGIARFCGVALLCGALLYPRPAWAGFFMLMDQNGDVSFTDTRPAKNSSKVVVKYFYNRSKGNIGSPGSYIFSNSYDHIISAAAHRNNLDPMLVKSVIKVESDFSRFTISSKGAQGLMQLMPDTARALGVQNAFDAEENIHAGARYLRRMLNRFDGNTRLALAAYNAGPTAVQNYGGVPPYKETINYIRKIMKAYSKLTGHNYPIASHASSVIVKQKKEKPVYTTVSSEGVMVFSDKPIEEHRIMKD